MAATAKLGWIRHVLTILSAVIFALGCSIIGYMAWVLASSVTVTRFLSGEMIITYVLVTIGLVLFFTGLVGWVAGASESLCILRLFTTMIIMCLAGELGGLISINIFRLQMNEIMEHSWLEMNQGTRNLIQQHLNCCGYDGPKDFAYNSVEMHESCYEPYVSSNITQDATSPDMELKQEGCGPKLMIWVDEHQSTWVPLLASVGGLQLLAFFISLFILQKVKRQPKDTSRSSSRRYLHEEQEPYDS